MLQIILFIVLNLAIFAVSWKFLFNPQTHGFYRFFVFETVLVLVILNLDFWIINPFSLLQIFSWIILIISIIFVVTGFYLVRKKGKPKGELDNTTELITGGIYKYIRHPLYSSLLFLGFGAFLKHITVTTGILMLFVIIFVILTAKMEEKKDIKKFGESYKNYISETKLLIPFVF